jgi:hypothetical protein
MTISHTLNQIVARLGFDLYWSSHKDMGIFFKNLKTIFSSIKEICAWIQKFIIIIIVLFYYYPPYFS